MSEFSDDEKGNAHNTGPKKKTGSRISPDTNPSHPKTDNVTGVHLAEDVSIVMGIKSHVTNVS